MAPEHVYSTLGYIKKGAGRGGVEGGDNKGVRMRRGDNKAARGEKGEIIKGWEMRRGKYRKG